MPQKNRTGDSSAAGADKDSDAINKLLWSDSTEEEYLRQIVGSNEIDLKRSGEDQAETSTLPGAIKAMDSIYVDENASLEPRYISSSLERILRFVKKKEVEESGGGNNASRDQTELVDSHDNDDNNTVDEMIEEFERQEETNLNNILDRIPTNVDSVKASPTTAATSTKNIRMNINKTMQDKAADSPANSSRKKSLTNTMNNSFTSRSNFSIRDGNDSLAGNETIGKIVTRIMDSGISTVGGEDERTLRSWTDFQPIAGSVATPAGKNSINNNTGSGENKFVTDDTSVGSISEEIEVIVAEHKRQLDNEVGGFKLMAEGDVGTQKNTMISSLSFDATYHGRNRSTLGGMPPTDENVATTPLPSNIEGEGNDEDVEKGQSEPWWVKAERLAPNPTKSSDETPSPPNSVGQSKEAPDTPSTVRIIGLVTPTSSEMDKDEFEDDRNTLKSEVNFFPERGRFEFLKRARTKYGRFYAWIIFGASAMLVLSIILVIAASAKLNKLNEKSDEPSSLGPTQSNAPYEDNIFDEDIVAVDIPPSDDASSLAAWSYVDDEIGSAEINLRTDSPSASANYEFRQTDFPTIFSDSIEDVQDTSDLDPQEDLFDTIQQDLEDFSDRTPNASLSNTDHPDFVFFYGRLEKAISEQLPESISLLENPTSPQFRALQWLRTNPPDIEELKFRPLVQKYVLAVLYYSTGGDEWLNNSGWLSNADECEWFVPSSSGSLCDSMGRVIELDLRSNNLVGSLPSELVLLSEYITRIRVNGNSLEGTIPSFLAEMTKLERFHIHWNSFTGGIPTNIGELSSTLLSFRVGHNKLRGTIPWQLRNLETLEALDLGTNQLTGTVPFFLGDLTTLDLLSLGNNQLTGTIPLEFMKLKSLAKLELDRNNLTGTMPTEVCSRLPLLEIVRVDCKEVQCWCCEGCND